LISSVKIEGFQQKVMMMDKAMQAAMQQVSLERAHKVLLGNPPCGRFGSKGAVYFVRVVGDLGNPKFRVRELAV